MKRIKILEWENISLVVPEREDIILWYEWINNIDTQTSLGQYWNIYYKEDEEECYENLRKDKTLKTFSIFVNKLEKTIWNISLMNIDNMSRNAEIWIMISDKDEQNKWYWTEALKLILKYAFEVLGLHKVCLKFIDFNKRAEKVYDKVWFKKVWILKDERYIFWKYNDVILMELLKSDYKK